jgi:hypothetical protein
VLSWHMRRCSQHIEKRLAVECGTRLRHHYKKQTGVWVDQRHGENMLSKTPTMRSIMLLIAVMHKQAVQHTPLYKRHVAMQ